MGKQSEATLLLKIKQTGESILSKTKSALGDIRTWAAAAFAALTTGAAVTQFKEAEEATNALNQTLINNGIYTKALAGDYDKMANQLQAVTTFEDDAIKKAQAQMQAYLGQTKISKDLMKATLDLAAAKKMDLASAAEMVGKAIGTGTNALARQGIELDKNATSSQKMASVVSQLSDKFGGQAEAATKGLGAMEQTKNVVGNLLELVGEKFAPFIIRAAQAVTALAQEIANSETFVFALEFSLQLLAKAFTVVKYAAISYRDILVAVFQGLAQAVTKISEGDFGGAIYAIENRAAELKSNLSKNWDSLQKELGDIDDIYVREKLAKQEEELRMTKQAAERETEIQDKAGTDQGDRFKARSEKELYELITQERLKTDAYLTELNKRIANEKNESKYLELELQKRQYLEDQYALTKMQREDKVDAFIAGLGIKRVDKFYTMLNDMEGMQKSKYGALVAVGKAAAIANIAIDTAKGAIGANAALASIPYVGPGLGIAAGTAITAYGIERAGTVAGINMAEGGIVKATPGGVHAIIGEAGRDEAVVPLDGSGGVMGTTLNIYVQGGVLGSRADLREYALELDKEFFRLRQSNESIAFDRSIT